MLLPTRSLLRPSILSMGTLKPTLLVQCNVYILPADHSTYGMTHMGSYPSDIRMADD